MATRRLILRDVAAGRRPPRLRLLAPLRYLAISHREKNRYDLHLPLITGFVAWILFLPASANVSLFGSYGLFTIAQSLLTMAIPFLFGSLAAVAMGSPGAHFDSRPPGVALHLDGKVLTLRQFVCYLLGYLVFISLLMLGFVIAATVFRPAFVIAIEGSEWLKPTAYYVGTFVFFMLSSIIGVTTLWSLYFLTEIVSRADAGEAPSGTDKPS